MFERFTERAKWAMHRARSEAGRMGSPRMSSEHLLLGVMEEERSFFYAETAEALIRKIEKGVARGAAVPDAANMPLTEEAKAILATCGEKTDGVQPRPIEALHLLWALAKHTESGAGRLLAEAGITPAQVEAEMKKRGLR